MRQTDSAEVIPVKEKSVKRLTKTLAVVSLLVPMSAQPLGIGELELHSALNQTLNAEIRLHLAPGENPADIKVRLAPPEKFDQAGVPWSYFLSKIKFQTVERSDGSLVIKVTSREALTEPFLDFLLEVSWPQGSQFREFTALIDPPADYRAPVVPTATALNNYQVEGYAESYDRPVKKSRSSKKRVTHSSKPSSNISAQTPSSGEYGPVQANVTLWRIAEQIGSERGVATKQMLSALYQANPDAFNNGNIDSLKVGATLKIPETDAILKSGGSRIEQKSARKAVAKPETPTNKALELVAPSAEVKIADSAKIDGQVKTGQESIETANNTGSGGSTTGGKDIELQTRIERLEQQLNMMQELLALKDQQLATLQGKENAAVQQPTTEPKPEPTAPPPVVTPTEPKPAPELQPVTPKPEPSVQPPIATPQPEAVKPIPTPVKPLSPPKPAPVEAVEPEDDLFSSPFYNIVVGGISVGIIGLLGWLLWRKRKIESKTNTDSMFASASQIKMPDSDSSLALPVLEMNSTASYDVGTVGESSFISDFTPSDFEAFDTDQSEIDPLSEADVYLAYGRYQQAEDLIRQAIKDHPVKDEYKLKLLEIFYANENKERFTDYAQELADAGKTKDFSFWNKVSDMGKEVIPESALFGGAGIVLKPSIAEVTTHSEPSQLADFDADNDLDLDVDLSNADFIDLNAPNIPNTAFVDDINPEESEWQLHTPETDDNSLDFDLSLFSDSKNTQKPTEQNDSTPDIESIDFNFSDMETEIADVAENGVSDTHDALADFDFNFDLDSPEVNTTKQEKNATLEESLDMASLESFEFPDFENDNNLDALDQAATQPTSDNTSDEFDFNFNFDTPNSQSFDEEIDLGVSDLTDMDEFETKIDLAKAYVDMGDTDAAKSIAEEVLLKGNQEQKQAAQTLLNELK